MARTKIVFWDVYGTLIAAERGDLSSLRRRRDELLDAFEKTVRNFSLPMSAEALQEHFLDVIESERKRRKAEGVVHPEIRIEEIWLKLLDGATLNHAREVALFFERHANPKRFQPHAFDTLVALKQRGVRQGIISNAQFYTLIELGELLREESKGAVCTSESIFDPRLIFLSCDLGITKPDPAAFQRAREILLLDGVLPDRCLMVGDSLENDIQPARAVGFRAAWFAPDGDVTNLVEVLDLL